MTDTQTVVTVFAVEVNGRSLTMQQQDAFVSAIVERTSSACDRFELRFDQSRYDGRIATIGDAVRISADTGGTWVTLIAAEITGKTIEVRNRERSLVLSGYDRRHRLTRSVATRAYNDATLRTVASTIAGDHGLQLDDRTRGSLTTTTFPHLMQAGTDFEMMQQITYRVGAEWLIDGTRLVVQTREQAENVATLSPEHDLVSFTLRYSPVESVDAVTVHGGWDPVRKSPITGSASGVRTKHQFSVEQRERAKLTHGSALSWATPMTSATEADATARALGSRLVESAVVGHGETLGTPKLAPGTLCTIQDIGDDFGGTYHIVGVEHSFGRERPFRTRFRVGPLEPPSLVDVFDADSRAWGRVFTGVTVGVVTNIAHPEGRTGMVKVNFPYLGREVESNWARLASFGGGKGRGSVFIPEVDDEVIVAFEHGDVKRPYVIGTVWSGDKDALFDRTVGGGKVQERTIVSRLGTKVRFIDVKEGDDTSGLAAEVDGTNARLFLGYKRTELVTKQQPIELKSGRASIRLENDEITLTGTAITLKTTGGDVQIQGKNVTVKANASLSLEGAQAQLKAQAQASLQASGIMVIKGSIVKVN